MKISSAVVDISEIGIECKWVYGNFQDDENVLYLWVYHFLLGDNFQNMQHTHKTPNSQVNKFIVVDTIYKKRRFKIKDIIVCIIRKKFEKTNIKGKVIEEDTRRKKKFI